MERKFMASIVYGILGVNGFNKGIRKENIPKEGGFVVACTHNGYIDILNLGISMMPKEIHLWRKTVV